MFLTSPGRGSLGSVRIRYGRGCITSGGVVSIPLSPFNRSLVPCIGEKSSLCVIDSLTRSRAVPASSIASGSDFIARSIDKTASRSSRIRKSSEATRCSALAAPRAAAACRRSMAHDDAQCGAFRREERCTDAIRMQQRACRRRVSLERAPRQT